MDYLFPFQIIVVNKFKFKKMKNKTKRKARYVKLKNEL